MIGWVVETLVASTLLMALVLAVRTPVARSFGPHLPYGLWLLPAARMVLPPLPETIAPGLHLLAPVALPAQTAAAAPALPPMMFAGPLPAAAVQPATDWGLVAIVLWLAMAALFFGWQMLRYAQFVTVALKRSLYIGEQNGLPIHASPLVEGPVAAGIIARRIFVPVDFDTRYQTDEQRLALMHEAAHHARRDILANAVALAMLALHWWNPLAHAAYRAFRADQELACDAAVLARAGQGERHAYGVALVKSAWGGLPAGACAMNTGDQLKRRLKMMTSPARSRPRTAAGALLAAGLATGGLLLTASAGVAAAEPAQKGRNETIVIGRDGTVVNGVRRPLTAEERKRVDRAVADARKAIRAVNGNVARAVRDATRGAAAAERARIAADASALAAEAVAEAHQGLAEAHVELERADVAGQVEGAIAEARAELHARCKAEGTPVDAGETDFGVLAMCGRGNLNRLVLTSLEAARAGLEAARHDLDAAKHDAALARIDAQIARRRADLR